jgi:hypothetical protein
MPVIPSVARDLADGWCQIRASHSALFQSLVTRPCFYPSALGPVSIPRLSALFQSLGPRPCSNPSALGPVPIPRHSALFLSLGPRPCSNPSARGPVSIPRPSALFLSLGPVSRLQASTQCIQHLPDLCDKGERGSDGFSFTVTQSHADQELRVNLGERALRIRNKVNVVARRPTIMTLGNIRRYRNSRAPKLRCQTITLVRREAAGVQIDILNQCHGFLPHDEVLKPANFRFRHRAPVSFLLLSSGPRPRLCL